MKCVSLVQGDVHLIICYSLKVLIINSVSSTSWRASVLEKLLQMQIYSTQKHFKALFELLLRLHIVLLKEVQQTTY